MAVTFSYYISYISGKNRQSLTFRFATAVLWTLVQKYGEAIFDGNHDENQEKINNFGNG